MHMVSGFTHTIKNILARIGHTLPGACISVDSEDNSSYDLDICRVISENVDNVDRIDGHVMSEINERRVKKRNADTTKQQDEVRSFIKAALYGDGW